MTPQEWAGVLLSVGGSIAGGVRLLWGWYSSERAAEREAREKAEARSESRTERVVVALTANTAAMDAAARAHDAQSLELRRLAAIVNDIVATPSGRITYAPQPISGPTPVSVPSPVPAPGGIVRVP